MESKNNESIRNPHTVVNRIAMVAAAAAAAVVLHVETQEAETRQAADNESFLRRVWSCLSDEQKDHNCNRSDVPDTFKVDFCEHVED